MKKDKFNAKFKEHARTLSPKFDEQILVNNIYQSFNDLFGDSNCVQIGSFPRFTAITPVHDLDLLYVIGNWDELNHTPATAMASLLDLIKSKHVNPTEYDTKMSLQTHSVTISFFDGTEERLSVDIVPAYIYAKNEFDQDVYKVPEIIKEKSHDKRVEFYSNLQTQHKQMGWLTSDPRGYIKVASETDANTNGNFRKSVKLVKSWKHKLAEADEKLKLKSFHLEQVITNYYRSDATLEIFDVIFKFFKELPRIIEKPNVIQDRVNIYKYVDDYLSDLTQDQKLKIASASHRALIALEQLASNSATGSIFEPNFVSRNPDEEFMFDFDIPIHHDEDGDPKFQIDFDEVSPNRFSRRLAEKRKQPIGNKIYFKIIEGQKDGMSYWWKVKNSDLLEHSKRRGEITKGSTKNNPENTQYLGNHYVECYAVDSDGICTDRARVDVIIEDNA